MRTQITLSYSFLALAASLALPALCVAQTSWSNAGTGDWFDAANWNNGVPTAGTNTFINNGGTADITAAGAVAGAFRVGDSATGFLTISGAGGFASGITSIGFSPTASGGVTISAGSWTNSSNLIVGNAGTGTFNLSGTGTVSNLSGWIGNVAGSTGTATMNGGTWTNSGGFEIGRSGTGTLNFNSGTISNVDAFLGSEASGTGTATMTGGTWTNSGQFRVGNNGTGTLNLSGGAITNTIGAIGNGTDSTGTATISGGTWTNSGTLTVGNNGTGTLTISGGAVSNTIGIIGDGATGSGTATVTSGSWTNSGNLVVGGFGDGAFNLSGTGTVSNTNGWLGAGVGSTGTATVDGGTWTNSAGLEIGRLGTGFLNFNDGTISNVDAFLGSEASGTGTATMTGGIWTNSGQLRVGNNGTGTLNLSGGAITNTIGAIGNGTGSTGTATVSGGTWSNSGGLEVGRSGTGILNFDGGTISNVDAFLGSEASGDGTVTMTGGTWTNSGQFRVGNNGTGTLNLSGGTITNTIGAIGNGTGSTGTATVSGGTWTNSSTLTVGNNGTGFLTISGGDVFNTIGSIGAGATGIGTATVTSGSWTNSGNLEVGRFGTGILNLNGGTLSNVDAFLGSEATGNGTVNMTGGTWTNGGEMYIGNNGVGTLNFSGGTLTGSPVWIGYNTGSTGSVHVSGGTWTTGMIVVGRDGDGSLEISGTAAVTSIFGDIAGNAGSTGSMKISDASWQMATFNVGRTGHGTLEMSGTASISATAARIGFISGSNGLAQISGGTLTSSSFLHVGSEGEGTLIMTAGSVSAALVSVADSGASTGTVTLGGGILSTGQVWKGIGTGGGSFTFENGGTLRLTSDQASLFAGFSPGDVTFGVGGGILDTQVFNVGIASDLYGAGSLTKQGSGTLRLSGVNTYGGGTLVSGGILVGTNADAFGTGSITVDNAELSADGDFALDNARDILVASSSGNPRTGLFSASTGRVFTLAVDDFEIGHSGSLQFGTTGNNGTVVFQPFSLTTSSSPPLISVAEGTLSAGNSTLLYQLLSSIDTETNIASGATLDFNNQLLTTSGIFHLLGSGALQSGLTPLADLAIRSGNFSGSISGAALLEKVGPDSLALSGANTYTGGTSITGGVLRISANQNLGAASGGLSIDGGRLRTTGSFTTARATTLGSGGGEISTEGSTTLTHNGIISGPGSLTKLGNGVLRLNGNNLYAGGTILENGVLVLGHDNALGTSELTIRNGTTLATPTAFLPFTTRTINNDILVEGNFTVLPQGQLIIISSLQLNGAMDLTGGTRTITNGTEFGPLYIGGVISNGGLRLEVDPFNVSGFFRFNGPEANTYTGNTRVGEFTTLTLDKDANVTAVAGDLVINDFGNVIILNDEQIADTSLVRMRGESGLRLGLLSNVTESIGSLRDDGIGLASIQLSGLLAGSTIRIGEGNFLGEISGGGFFSTSLEKYGPGVLVLSGFNTYRGDTAITGGVLRVSANENLGGTSSGLFMDGGRLRTTESFATSRSTELGAAGGEFSIQNSTSLTHSGTITGPGSLTKLGNGSLELDGTNTYTGGTIIDAGTLQIGAGGTTGSIVGDVANSGTLAFNRSDDVLFDGEISGTGALQKLGSGALTLSGASTYSGATSVDSGALLVNGSLGNTEVRVGSGALLGGNGTIAGVATLANGGILAPGNSAGTITLGELILNNSSLLNYELGDPMIPSSSDRTQVNGNLTLDGILNITALSGFGNGTYQLFGYTGSLIDNGLLFGAVPGLFDLTLDFSMANQVNLLVAASTAQFWDGPNTVPNGVINGGTGIWDSTTTNWTNAEGSANNDWKGTHPAIFSGTAGTVTVANETLNIHALRFLTDGYELVAGGTDSRLTMLGGESVFFADTDVSAEIDVEIGGASRIVKIGAGRIDLLANNTFTGGIDLLEGTLGFSQAEALGTGSLRIFSGTLAGMANENFVNNPVEIHGSFGIEVNPFDDLIFLGPVEVTGGERLVQLSGEDGLVSFEGALTGVGGLNFQTTETSFDVFFAGSDDNTMTGPLIIGNGVYAQLDKSTGSVAVAGNLIVEEGGLVSVFADLAQITPTSEVTIDGTLEFFNLCLCGSNTATFASLNGTGTVVNEADTVTLRVGSGFFAGILTDSGLPGEELNLVKTGPGTLTLSGANIYTGTTDIIAGVLRVATGGTLGSPAGMVTVAPDASLELGGSVMIDNPMTISGAGNGNGALVSVAGNNSTSGLITLADPATIGVTNHAVLNIGTGITGANQNLTFAGDGSIFVTGDITTGTGGVTSSAGNLFLRGTNTYTGDTIVNGGTVALGNGQAIADTGAIIVNAGTLQVETSEAIGSISGGGNLILDAGQTLSTGGNNSSTTFSGVASGDGALTKAGTGTFTLTGANTYSGGTTIDAGTLITTAPSALGTGPVTLNNGTLAPVGLLNITSLNWKGGTISTTLGETASLLNIEGTLSLEGTGQFDMIAVNGFAPNANYNILNAANLADFAAANFMGNSLFGISPVFTIIGNQLFVNFVGPSTGPILQNSSPVFTPLNADFLVNGEVVTGGRNEDNTVNSLTFNPDSSLEVFNNLTVTSGNFNVPTGSALLKGGSVIAPGIFSKLGEGVLEILSNIFVDGAAQIFGGTLLVNGSFNAPGGLTVFEDAVLGGEGIIGGNVFNNGIVAPGNSPGILTIIGDFTQSSNGTLEIEVGDLLRMSGTASLAGTLRLLDGGGLSFGQQVGFLEAERISGEFDEIVTSNPSRFRARFLSNGGIGALLIGPTSYTQVAVTTNQKKVARALDSFIPARGNDREVVSIALDRQSEAQYPAAFDLIAPTYYESLGNITVEQAFAQTQQMNQRMSAVRLGARGFHAIGIEPEPLLHDRDGKSVLDSKEITPEHVPSNPQWSLWAMGSGMFAKVSNVSQVPNYRFDSGGFLVGADYTFTQQPSFRDPQFTVGVYGGYDYTWADAGDAGNTQINTALFGGYASYSHGGFYADAIVGGGYNDYSVRRSIEFSTIDRTARSKPNGGQFNTSINLGYDWQVGKFTFGPIAGLQYTYAGIGGFTESGADSLNLKVSQQNINSLRSTLGGRVAYTWEVADKILLIPEVRMFWQREFLNNPRNIGSALDGGAGPSFGYETSTPARDSVFAGTGVSAQFGERWNAFVYYNIDFGRQDFLGNMISSGVGFKW